MQPKKISPQHNSIESVTTKTDILELLDSTKCLTLIFFDLPETELNLSYGQGKWTVKQILHHLTDAEYIFQQRLKKIIAEPQQVIWAYDQDLWNEAFDYKIAPLKNKKYIYEFCRELNHDLVSEYYDKYGDRQFVHNITGFGTLKSEFARMALHNLSHNNQIQAALEKR